jgi:hypothetical protein
MAKMADYMQALGLEFKPQQCPKNKSKTKQKTSARQLWSQEDSQGDSLLLCESLFVL